MALGDGNLTNPNGRAVRLRVSCDTKYPYLITKIQNSLSKAFPHNKISIVIRPEKCVEVSCYSNKFEALLGWDAKAGSKWFQKARVPKWIGYNRDYIVKCLCGLIETDGSIYKDREYTMMMFVSIIPELAQDVYDMMVILGFKPRVYEVIPKSKFKCQPVFHVRLSRNVEEFLRIVQPQKI